jgi:hypothetical protein
MYIGASASPKDFPRSIHILLSGLKIRPVLSGGSAVIQITKLPSVTNLPEIVPVGESATRNRQPLIHRTANIGHEIANVYAASRVREVLNKTSSTERGF